ncbi:phosphoribosylformylglycinamidine synthase [Candidatus Kryptonium thompsonii]|uniref:Phosphoribosylformylglycinamidine synthase subunit PurL n=1 Tax=Candidatus Kryptonium thompsonii TaxID=1633631 RepID=A0A0P1P6Q0_9BACT|nr:phosphoribosylformylglycinamidine synthase subunit PurL [Candidatus Kryptonium thompsoni]CUS77623.1 phosphoribosylformylglycinamidine synthase [Candidatus Kryptonium thompsoni]CUS78036.1 phosphoribosylformylglycinamidine synthase [Candidatus Kryptonium thompsoni]CUS89877.1 phosphoribosylformylglycinamidine synthase [Candidatus Kryptonium thompsoni]CUS90394.1 phosphoribosylformylglycinamidine synthase [Candidatus Kryptonium thompsoni]CUS91769.1 phosphoribosylformylglycinamidine synthase [Can
MSYKAQVESVKSMRELAIELGLTSEEYDRIIELIGREPTFEELGMFSVMWSEHCSYKNSIAVLKTLPRSGGRLLVSAGEENAGLVDIGDGLAVAFKIESHNHPSAIEPYQGAATGVGGILRDIFTMGARPIAILDSLRFGDLTEPRVKYLFNGVVRGIADYGNSFGCPTVAGEVYFDKSYTQNPLVNAMAVGIVKHDEIVRAVAKGKGNPVLIVGSSTGRDGIHGATFASEEISEESESKRPSVQVGDPFTEKLLLEATLEAIKTGYVVGIQDMGAAGITCSTSEMSARGKSGMAIDLDLVPVREKGMSAYEILLSESQERMLMVVKKGFEDKIIEIFKKWDLNAVVIGYVTDDGMLKIKKDGKLVVDIPADSLVVGGGAPVYYREAKEPEYLTEVRKINPYEIPKPDDLNEAFLKLISSPNIASKEWVYQQYDTMVGTNTVVLPGGDAAVIRIKGTNKAISVKTDCNARYVYLNPYRGAMIAVAESARNVVCTGAEPVAITNCLNFGNPYKPEIFWQFKEAVRGMGDACRFFNTPVTGGNVSFYNESPDGAVYPTPVIGMLGIIDDLKYITTANFKSPGDLIVLLGRNTDEIGGSEYLARIYNKVLGDAPGIDLDLEKRVQRTCLDGIRLGLIKSAHDVSDGGIAVALAECCMIDKENLLGCEVELKDDIRPDFLLFGEGQSRIIVTVEEGNLKKFEEICFKNEIPYAVIGVVSEGKRIKINDWIDLEIEKVADLYYNAIRRIMEVI